MYFITRGLVIAGIISLSSVAFSQVLETETARLPKQGHGEVSAGYEFQTSREGTESAIPLTFNFGLLDRLELAVEPVVHTRIRPNAGQRASGFGDIEVTLTGLVFEESGNLPAIAVAGEIKFPSAHNSLIGTGEYDHTGYLLASKRFGNFDTHANIGYQVTGSPEGVDTKNVWNFATAISYHINPQFDVYAEVLGHTSPIGDGELRDGLAPILTAASQPDGGDGFGTGATELSGSEIVGTVGAGWYIRPNTFLSLGVSYDNSSAVLIHPDLTIKW